MDTGARPHNQKTDAAAETVQAILAAATRRPGWRVARPEYGSAGDSYLVSRQGERLMLKFTPLPPGLEQLSQLGVTPRLIGHGDHLGRPWVLQEYVAGYHPNSSWFANNLPALAVGLRRYHDDGPLRSVLLRSPDVVHAQDLALAREELRHARQALSGVWHEITTAARAFELYERQMPALHLAPEVPVHPDPNRKNFIVTGHTFFLIDWDGICLSDRLSDAGIMLWWYVPVTRWHEFFAAYGLELNQHALDRVYWWSARRSLQVAAWLAERGRSEAAREFFVDFVASAHQQANPHWQP